MVPDIRDEIFKNCINKNFRAAITVERSGCMAGINEAVKKAKEIGLTVEYCLEDGALVAVGDKAMIISGNPKQIAQAEEVVMGLMAMSSGIASAARQAIINADGKLKIVAGAWKKMPPTIKELVRHAVAVGGADYRITNLPFLYIDKNFVRMFGGIAQTMQNIGHIENMTKCIQLKGDSGNIVTEAEIAVCGGASIVMVDSGVISDVEKVVAHLTSKGLRERVQIAFAGGIKIEDIKYLAQKDIDILDIGLQIIAAPLLDMRLDVLSEKTSIEVNLFEKTELLFEEITLKNANLNQIADLIADVLQIDRKEVLVIDVQDSILSVDILRKKINLANIISKEKEILQKLAKIEGVQLCPNSSIHSEGILGLIAVSPEDKEKVLGRSYDMSENVQSNISRRVMIFPTGKELISACIKDTNSPLIKQKLEQKGFFASIGEIIDDDVDIIYSKFINALNEGYGVVITTGGTGAESKDCTIEAVLKLDNDAQTPYIMKFQKGSGRHKKDGVKIAVGQVDCAIIISLPGPNDEVKAVLDIIADNLINFNGKKQLAQLIAQRLREVLLDKSVHYKGNNHHK